MVLKKSYHDLDIFANRNIFVKGDISAYEYYKFVYEIAVHFNKKNIQSGEKDREGEKRYKGCIYLGCIEGRMCKI